MRLSSSPANALQVAVALEGCQRLEEIQQLVRAFATLLGYHRFALFSISASEEGVVEHLYWLEGEWLESGEAVDLHAYMRECPMAMHIRERDQPSSGAKRLALLASSTVSFAILRGRADMACRYPSMGRWDWRGR